MVGNIEEIDFEEEDSFSFIKEKNILPHWTGWQCPNCKKDLYDEGGNTVFFICKNCEFTFFKKEIRASWKGEKCPIIPVEYDWEEEWKRLWDTEKGSASLNTLIGEGSGHKGEPESTEDLSDRSGRPVTPSVKQPDNELGRFLE